MSILQEVFPSWLREGVIRPFLKKPSLFKRDMGNYQPVPNLSLLAKVS